MRKCVLITKSIQNYLKPKKMQVIGPVLVPRSGSLNRIIISRKPKAFNVTIGLVGPVGARPVWQVAKRRRQTAASSLQCKRCISRRGYSAGRAYCRVSAVL